MGALSLAVSAAVLLATQGSMSGTLGLFFASLVVALVLATGLLFDMVGVAVAAAPPEPFHARAARDHAGAAQSLRLLRNADRVANFCLDFVGDVAGTLTGAMATAAAYRLAGGGDVVLWGALAVGAVAGVNVGAKAVAKAVALRDSVAVVRVAGEVLSWTERVGAPPILAAKGKSRRGRR